MWTGTLALDLVLGDVHSRKEKRAVVRPVIAAIKRLDVSVAEVGHLDLHRRARVGVAVVAADAGHVREVLASCERLVADRPEVEVLSAHTQHYKEGDE